MDLNSVENTGVYRHSSPESNAPFTMNELLADAIENLVPDCNDPGANPVPWCCGRGRSHSLNDGNRDSRWRRRAMSAKRFFKSAGSYLRDSVYCGIDEVGSFMLKVVGASLLLYAVVVSGLSYYG